MESGRTDWHRAKEAAGPDAISAQRGKLLARSDTMALVAD
jgi:hypothetical protein